MSLEPTQYKKAISKVWRRVRIASQVNREYVARALGVSKSTIDKIEQGSHHVRLYDVIRFCQALNFCPQAFMQQVVNDLPPPPAQSK